MNTELEREEVKTEEKKGKFLGLFQTRISMVKVVIWILLLVAAILIQASLEMKYPPSARDSGFKFGYKYGNGYVFPFYYDVEYGQQMIDDYDNVYSNIDLYILAKDAANTTITILICSTKNESIILKNMTKIIELQSFRFTKVHIEMPKIDARTLAILLVDSQEIVRFFYRFNILYQEIKTTIGNMLMTQIVYVIGGFIILLFGMLVAKGIANIYVTPDPDLKTAGYFLTIAGAILYYTTKEIILRYGVANAIVMYVPFFIFAVFAGLYIVGKQSKQLLLIRVSDRTTIETISLKAKKVENAYWKTPKFGEFLIYKAQKIIWDKYELIFQDVGDHDYVIYFADIKEMHDKIEIVMSGIHKVRVEEYKSNIKAFETLSEMYEKLNENAIRYIKLYKLLAIKKARKELADFLDQLERVLKGEEE